MVGVKVTTGVDEESGKSPKNSAVFLSGTTRSVSKAQNWRSMPKGVLSLLDGGGRQIAFRWLRLPGERRLVARKSSTHSTVCISHLRDQNWSISRRGNVTVIVSSVPQQGCDLYLYHDAFSFRGKQAGYDLLLLSEPFVVLPGEYNEDVWDHFDHAFTFYDAPIEQDRRFTKILSWCGDWSIETAPPRAYRKERSSIQYEDGRTQSA